MCNRLPTVAMKIIQRLRFENYSIWITLRDPYFCCFRLNKPPSVLRENVHFYSFSNVFHLPNKPMLPNYASRMSKEENFSKLTQIPYGKINIGKEFSRRITHPLPTLPGISENCRPCTSPLKSENSLNCLKESLFFKTRPAKWIKYLKRA